ncbi:hypothetical protein HNY73_007525 [Argiope bruennichi]|uniref:Uncharacterized protein n=1 Tax=Argiope bruennichi TaxID=94029 RepID=A0A8T0FGS4_ARGBR|nr:hypothetical protein HNY73_007525 [Argiope bruennichi]
MERDGRSDDSSSCKSGYSNRSVYSNKTFCNGNSTVASEFVVSIMNHCRDLKNWNRELTSAINRKCQTNKRLEGCSPSEKAGLLKRLEDLNRLIKCNEEKLKNAKPCMNKGCRTHDGDSNLCAYISTSQERMLRLNYAASTFLDTLQQMKESKLEHTAQYTDDFAQLKKIQAEIRQIANELDDVTPCSVDNCERHTPDNLRQPLLTENLEHTTEREIAVMGTGNTPEKNNKDENQPVQMDIESESPFQPVDKRHTAKRKNSVENPDVTWPPERMPCLSYNSPTSRNRRSYADILGNRNSNPEKATESAQNPPAPRQRPQHQQQAPNTTPTLEAYSTQINIQEMKELFEFLHFNNRRYKVPAQKDFPLLQSKYKLDASRLAYKVSISNKSVVFSFQIQRTEDDTVL